MKKRAKRPFDGKKQGTGRGNILRNGAWRAKMHHNGAFDVTFLHHGRPPSVPCLLVVHQALSDSLWRWPPALRRPAAADTSASSGLSPPAAADGCPARQPDLDAEPGMVSASTMARQPMGNNHEGGMLADLRQRLLGSPARYRSRCLPSPHPKSVPAGCPPAREPAPAAASARRRDYCPARPVGCTAHRSCCAPPPPAAPPPALPKPAPHLMSRPSATLA